MARVGSLFNLGKYMERSCALPVLLDAYFSRAGETDDLDWVGLLASCAAFESYCKVYTADLKPDSMAEFLLLNPEFPYSVRYAVERMGAAIAAISQTSFTNATDRIERIAGQAARIACLRTDWRDYDCRRAPLPQRCH